MSVRVASGLLTAGDYYGMYGADRPGEDYRETYHERYPLGIHWQATQQLMRFILKIQSKLLSEALYSPYITYRCGYWRQL